MERTTGSSLAEIKEIFRKFLIIAGIMALVYLIIELIRFIKNSDIRF